MINVAYFTAIILVFIRLSSFFITIPTLFPKGFPNTAKVALVLIISVILIPGIDYSNITTINNILIFGTYVFYEAITGLTLGYITNLCFFSARMAGQLMDTQVGFSMISMFDPNTNSNTTLIENLLHWFSIMVFFIIGGHHMLIKALIRSFEVVKLGGFILSQDSIMIVVNAFIEFFNIGLKIALPIILIIIITDITMGLISRTVPQLNLMVLGMPVKILIGLVSLSLILPILVKMITINFTTLSNILTGFFKAVPLIMIFASDDKTEEATPKKKSEARKKGQIPKSKEVNLSVTLVTSTILLLTLGGYIGNSLKNIMLAYLSTYQYTALDDNSIRNILYVAVYRVAITVLPFIVPIMILGVAANLLQTGFLVTGEPLQPKLSKLNPISGIKKIFSMRTVVELFKDMAIVSVLGYIGFKFVKDNYQSIISLFNAEIGVVPVFFGKLVINIFFKISIIMLIISLIDYLYQRYQFNKDLRMSKQEIKEEFKQDEGDPQIKSKIKQKQRELARRRMMQEVPKATVIVTNPTHVAVALKYQEGEGSAPLLVAKGLNAVALRIKEIAKENDVPIIENRALARLIYSEVEIGIEIPVEMYQAVAEILALVYKMKKKK